MPITAHLDEGLRRGSIDLVLLPVELAEQLSNLPYKALFQDNFVLVADRDNPMLGSANALEGDGAGTSTGGSPGLGVVLGLPFVAVAGEMPSLIEVQLRRQGIELRIDVTTEAFVVAPMLLRGTSMVGLIQERLARLLAEQAHLSLYRSPIDVGGITEAMYWNPRRSEDPAHRWLRTQLIAQAQRT